MCHLSQKACQRAVYLTVNITTGQLKYFHIFKFACCLGLNWQLAAMHQTAPRRNWDHAAAHSLLPPAVGWEREGQKAKLVG